MAGDSSSAKQAQSVSLKHTAVAIKETAKVINTTLQRTPMLTLGSEQKPASKSELRFGSSIRKRKEQQAKPCSLPQPFPSEGEAAQEHTQALPGVLRHAGVPLLW